MFGLTGIVILTAAVYALTVVRLPGNCAMDTSARISPVGAVIPAGEGMAGPAVAIYERACAACHDTGVVNAPKLGDQAAWEPRMMQGIPRLLRTVIAGKGAMPPRGACVDCSDADLQAAIEYMLAQANTPPHLISRPQNPPNAPRQGTRGIANVGGAALPGITVPSSRQQKTLRPLQFRCSSVRYAQA